jgi:hypothetical protein
MTQAEAITSKTVRAKRFMGFPRSGCGSNEPTVICTTDQQRRPFTGAHREREQGYAEASKPGTW